MYTAYLGRRIIDLYNTRRRAGKPLSPRAFFDEVIFPSFFDDEIFLMWVNNSAFDQRYKQRKRRPLTTEIRQEALVTFHEDADKLTEPHGHLYLGGTARDIDATTSGQITSLSIEVDADDVYCSWVGAAASIGVSGGLSLLIDEDEVLLALLDGWMLYRRYIKETPGLLGHQIETWNGGWIAHFFSEDYDERRPLRDFEVTLKKSGSNFRLDTQDWIQVLFALASQLPDRTITAYVFTFGNTNQTIGFRQVHLPDVRHFADLYLHLFGENDGVRNPTMLAKLYETEFGFRTICRHGAIGLRSIQPAKLRDYVPHRGVAKKIPKPPKNEDQRFTFHLYLTWIYAMLDNQDLISLAEQAADALRSHATSDTKGRATAKRRAEQALEASGRRAFVEHLTEIVQNDGEHAKLFDDLVNAVIKMPHSDFPLLLTLIRFKYHVQA